MKTFDRERWNRVAVAAGLDQGETEEAFYILTKLHAEAHRRYHNTAHILECLSEFDEARNLAADPVALEMAIWFHDAVYDPRAADNEERSAFLAWEFCGNERVRELILATKHASEPKGVDAELMVDIDLAILGKPSSRFWEYEEQIRAEYAFVPEELFKSKRAEILENFLARPSIYRTQRFRERYETTARENLAASIQRLRTPRS